MPTLTITEALQEIKTINARIGKKRSAVGNSVMRDSRLRDPFEEDGGSAEYVKRERQAISDLENRIISIRTAIQRANLTSNVTVIDKTRSVAEWLTWRREIASGQKEFYKTIVNGINGMRQKIQQQGGTVNAVASAQVNLSPTAPPEVLLSVNEREMIENVEHMETVLGTLDGKLSLFNATATIEI